MLIAAIAAFAAFMPATASANLTPTYDQTFSDPTPGAHSTYTNVQTFTPSGSAPHVDNEDLRKWIIDSPAGQYGNNNVIPFADRCTLAQFNTTIDPGSDGLPPFFNACPASSAVGVAAVLLRKDTDDSAIDANGAAPNLSFLSGFNPSFADSTGILPNSPTLWANGTPGTIYLLQTTPEVPTTLATFFFFTASRTKSILQPVTMGADGDFRIRVIPADNSAHPVVASGPTPAYISQIMQRLHGLAPNGNPYLSNPTRCGDWTGYSYATEYDPAGNTNADSNPDLENPGDGYKKSAPDTVVASCATLPKFAPTTSVTLSTGDRDSNPQLNVTVDSNAVPGEDYPKKVVTTLPASITTDVQGIATPCEVADRDAATCPAASKVGSATVSTPLLTAGLTGDVYMVRGTGKAIPDLAIFFNNPPNSIRKFRMDGITKFVGPNNNQIETTFDNGPQNVFTSFTVTIDGGTAAKPDSLLTISKCPDGSSSPEDGPITYSMTGFSGQSATSSTTPVLKDCFGLAKLKKLSRCVRTKLKVSPSYKSRDKLQKSELWIKYKTRSKRTGRIVTKYKRVKRVKTSPFRFNVKISNKKFKHGNYRYKVRAVYKPTTSNPKNVVLQRHSKFKKC